MLLTKKKNPHVQSQIKSGKSEEVKRTVEEIREEKRRGGELRKKKKRGREEEERR